MDPQLQAMIERNRKNGFTEDELRAALEAEHRERREVAWVRLCRSSSPPLLPDTEPDRLPEGARSALPRVMAWLPGPRGLLLQGKTRSGKTRLLTLLAQKLVLSGRAVVAIRCDVLAERIRAAQKADGLDGADEYRRRLSGAEVLWLDDLGKSRLREGEADFLWGLLDDRLAHGRPLLVTTEHDRASLLAKMAKAGADAGAATIGRLLEMCAVVGL